MDNDKRKVLKKEREVHRMKLEEKRILREARKEIIKQKLTDKSISKEIQSSLRKEYQNKYYLDNKESISNRKKKLAEDRLHKKRLERVSNPVLKKARTSRKKYPYKKQSDEQKIKVNTRTRERRKLDSSYRLASVLRARLNHALKGRTKVGSAIKFLGCSVDYLRVHLESQFVENMSWDNYGSGKDKWSIDHIIPLSMVDLTDESKFAQVNHYTNLRPLWNTDQIILYHTVQKKT